MSDGNDNQIINPDEDPVVGEQLFMLRVLHGALVFASLIYVAVCWVAVGGQPRVELAPVIVAALGGVALLLAGATPFIRRLLMPPTAERSAGAGPTRAQARRALARMVSAHIVSCALTEAIAILGLMLSFLTHDLRYVVGFVAFALLLFALYFPRADLVRSVVRGAEELPR